MSVVWDERGGATVVRDGFPQSYVDPDDPLLLVFEYVEQFALVLQALRPDPAPLAVTHVGGAGMTLARWLHRTHPGSPQIVLEPDVALTELVRRELPLPRGHRIRVRPVTGQRGCPPCATARPTSSSSTPTTRVSCRESSRAPAGRRRWPGCCHRTGSSSSTPPTSRVCAGCPG
ncbi:spermidine synthase [Ornithinimicrobium flavum]|uniref:spermidine synthase n=1 Tax=Ornithinimicrobium flavum TaxID=1288636 RepID=UPI0018820874|nr:hypothetical protein [Ornithinimicrobium flavum]